MLLLLLFFLVSLDSVSTAASSRESFEADWKGMRKEKYEPNLLLHEDVVLLALESPESLAELSTVGKLEVEVVVAVSFFADEFVVFVLWA